MPDLLELNSSVEPKIEQLKQSLMEYLNQRLLTDRDLRGLVPDYYLTSYAEDFDQIQSEIIERLLDKHEGVLELSHLADSEIGVAGGMVNLIGADGVAYFSIPLQKFDFLNDADRWVFAIAARRGLIDDLIRMRARGGANTAAESRTFDRAINTLRGEVDLLLTSESEQLATDEQPTIEDYLQPDAAVESAATETTHLN